MKYKNYMFFLLIMIIIASCTSVPIYRLTVLDEEYSMYKGREVVEKETNKSYTALSYEYIDDNCLVFYLFIENKQNSSLLVDPAGIFIESSNDKFSDSVISNRRHAVDPEQRILELEQFMESRDDEYTISTCLNCLLGSIDFISEISSDEGSNGMEAIEEWSNNQDDENFDYEEDMFHLNEEKYFWENELLRITELKRREKIGGLIYVPLNKNKKFHKVVLNLGEDSFTFNYHFMRLN